MTSNKTDTRNDQEQSTDSELQRLHKQLRKMEKDRISFIEDKKCKSTQKLKILQTLKRERDSLRQSINSIQGGQYAKRKNEHEGEMKKLLVAKENVQKTFEDQKGNLWQLEGHIKKIQKELARLTKIDQTDKMYNEEIFRVQKNILKLENQLDVVIKRCGEVMTENSSLRRVIDHMLLERSNFNGMWKQIVNQIDHGKRYIIELIDQSTSAYDQRDDLCSKIQNLREKGLTESSVHMQEIRELQRKLDHDAKLQQFYSIKGHQRQNIDLDIRESQKKLLLIEHFQKQIDSYQKILDNISVICGASEPTKFGELFCKQEDENFALFSYVNELGYEVETLNETVQLVQDDIDRQKMENETKEKSQLESVDVLQCEYNVQQEKVVSYSFIVTSISNQIIYEKANQILNGSNVLRLNFHFILKNSLNFKSPLL